jgi:glutamate synthase (NADPH/NADH) small chain
MGDLRGFITLRRADPTRRPVSERVQDWDELYRPLPEGALREQGARCMDCGVPFCQGDTGCPVENVVPDWNDLVYRGRWREAFDALHATNNFPELTGRLCPAPCESACVLGLIDRPVAIRTIEQAIADRGFAEGWVVPRPPARETGARVAIVGSGPAGLAAAQQLRRAGHRVTVYERASRVGGLLRYGIPSFKLDKTILDRRCSQIAAEGVVFETGRDIDRQSAARLAVEYDAVLIATGADIPRDLSVPGRELDGIHFAMDYLVHGPSAKDKRVVILGGGDTGSDCLGTCHRQGAREVFQFEVLPTPPVVRTSHAHEEGGLREWSVATTGFEGINGRVVALRARRVDTPAVGQFTVPCDMVILAMGFTGTRGRALAEGANAYLAGDARRGASLIVWAIREGRDAARAIDRALT